ncbi:MAG: hypothetical protein ACT4NY_32475 [Pseudonocardiales bacterium]
MRGLPRHRPENQEPDEEPAPAQCAPAECGQCGRDMTSSPSIYWCSEGCMRRWLRAGTREPEAVLGRDADDAADRMARRQTYLSARTGSWPDTWRLNRSA